MDVAGFNARDKASKAVVEVNRRRSRPNVACAAEDSTPNAAIEPWSCWLGEINIGTKHASFADTGCFLLTRLKFYGAAIINRIEDRIRNIADHGALNRERCRIHSNRRQSTIHNHTTACEINVFRGGLKVAVIARGIGKINNRIQARTKVQRINIIRVGAARTIITVTKINRPVDSGPCIEVHNIIAVALQINCRTTRACNRA